MIRRKLQSRRRGAALVETAIIMPIAFLLILGTIVAGTGVYRYQQVATLAREAARHAAVHGGQYAAESGLAADTAATLLSDIIIPRGVGLGESALTCTVSWNTNNYPYHLSADNGAKITNTVSVTVSYAWLPEYFFGGLTLTSTSVMPMSY